MNSLMRVLLAGVLMAPALSLAQTSFPRCSDPRADAIDPRTVFWPSGGNGCRETLPEPPPPQPGDAIAEIDEFGPQAPSEVPPIWLDFDPTLVPTFDGTVMVGLDMRSVPSALEGVDGGRTPPLTVLEYALDSLDFSGKRHFDVISAKVVQTGFGTRLLVEHRRSEDTAWTAVKDSEDSEFISSATYWTNASHYLQDTLMLRFERRADVIVLHVNEAEVSRLPLYMRDATPYRLRRGLFGRDVISADDRVNLYWFKPEFYFAPGTTNR
jgi:hypothetical protein